MILITDADITRYALKTSWSIQSYSSIHVHTNHDLAKFVAFGADVVHEHLIRRELELNG